MAYFWEILQQILQFIRFRAPKNNKKDSYYTKLGNTLLRVSNHCTYMYVWDNYFEKNPKDKNMNIISIVFEDNKDTFNNNCLVLNRNIKHPINVLEYVFPIHGNGKYINKKDIGTIISDIKKIEINNSYVDNTLKSKCFKRISINPTSQNINQDKNGNITFTKTGSSGVDYVSENNINIRTNKKTIRLSESDLYKIIKESVRKILK